MKLKKLAATLAFCGLLAGHCAAPEYAMDTPQDYLFWRLTFVERLCGGRRV